ncbi:hypothetical protein C8R47DRAFT_1204635 [Mycena vitilis]|nr:hypothetical protein C8R47DRAFT_1204635 [Mycena vitilis]
MTILLYAALFGRPTTPVPQASEETRPREYQSVGDLLYFSRTQSTTASNLTPSDFSVSYFSAPYRIVAPIKVHRIHLGVDVRSKISRLSPS